MAVYSTNEQAGALRLADPVADYLPEFSAPQILVKYDPTTRTTVTRPARRPITIRDLLTHTAGIHHGHVEIDPVLSVIYVQAGVVFDSRLVLAEKIQRLGPLPLAMQRAYFFVPPAERNRIVSRYSQAGGMLRPLPRDPFEHEARYVSGGEGSSHDDR